MSTDERSDAKVVTWVVGGMLGVCVLLALCGGLVWMLMDAASSAIRPLTERPAVTPVTPAPTALTPLALDADEASRLAWQFVDAFFEHGAATALELASPSFREDYPAEVLKRYRERWLTRGGGYLGQDASRGRSRRTSRGGVMETARVDSFIQFVQQSARVEVRIVRGEQGLEVESFCVDPSIPFPKATVPPGVSAEEAARSVIQALHSDSPHDALRYAKRELRNAVFIDDSREQALQLQESAGALKPTAMRSGTSTADDSDGVVVFLVPHALCDVRLELRIVPAAGGVRVSGWRLVPLIPDVEALPVLGSPDQRMLSFVAAIGRHDIPRAIAQGALSLDHAALVEELGSATDQLGRCLGHDRSSDPEPLAAAFTPTERSRRFELSHELGVADAHVDVVEAPAGGWWVVRFDLRPR